MHYGIATFNGALWMPHTCVHSSDKQMLLLKMLRCDGVADIAWMIWQRMSLGVQTWVPCSAWEWEEAKKASGQRSCLKDCNKQKGSKGKILGGLLSEQITKEGEYCEPMGNFFYHY